MDAMDQRKLLLQSYSTFIFGYDGGLNDLEQSIQDAPVVRD